jgi:hypothetical protein
MEFGSMNVQVKILVSSQSTEQDLDSMKSAAELTNAPKSIVVSMQKGDRYFELIADFKMRRISQSAVFSDISQEFKFWTHSLKEYEDMIICDGPQQVYQALEILQSEECGAGKRPFYGSQPLRIAPAIDMKFSTMGNLSIEDL